MCKCNEVLNRYMAYERFERIVKNKELVLSDPLKDWKDDKECYLIKGLKDPNINDSLKRKSLQYTNDETQVINEIENTKAIRCQSWSRHKDDKKMWEEYSFDDSSVMVSTTRQQLCWLGLQLLDIEYTFDKNKVQSEIENLMDEKGLFWKKLFQKKEKQYEFEGEVRAIWVYDGDEVQFNTINQIINFVIVSPYADEECISKVQNICLKENIKLIRSKIQV